MISSHPTERLQRKENRGFRTIRRHSIESAEARTLRFSGVEMAQRRVADKVKRKIAVALLRKASKKRIKRSKEMRKYKR